MESKRLDNAALAAGISPNYINAHGKPQAIPAETKQRLLEAMNRTAVPKSLPILCQRFRFSLPGSGCSWRWTVRVNLAGC